MPDELNHLNFPLLVLHRPQGGRGHSRRGHRGRLQDGLGARRAQPGITSLRSLQVAAALVVLILPPAGGGDRFEFRALELREPLEHAGGAAGPGVHARARLGGDLPAAGRLRLGPASPVVVVVVAVVAVVVMLSIAPVVVLIAVVVLPEGNLRHGEVEPLPLFGLSL